MAKSLYYWDSCVFLDFISATPGRVGDIQSLLEAAERADLEIVTSTFTVAEVAYAHAERQSGVLDPSVEQKIDALWLDGGPVRLVEFTQLTAERARNIMRQALANGWAGLSAKDAVHLATAQPLGVDEVHTYDNTWSRHGPQLGLKIMEPRSPAPSLGL